MLLVEALSWQPRDVLACVGAGGKTSTCWRLWQELARVGQIAIWATTTHIFEPIVPREAALLLSTRPNPIHIRQIAQRVPGLIVARTRLAAAPDNFEPNPVVPARPTKLAGFAPPDIDMLIEQLPDVNWIVEADGAHGRGLKMPADHEPAIPTRATLVAVLAHLDTLGQPLDSATVHRPELFAQRVQAVLGEHITVEHVVRALTDPLGGLKGIPPGARVVGVLNQREATLPHPQAARVAQGLLASGQYERVVIASLRAPQPILEVMAE